MYKESHHIACHHTVVPRLTTEVPFRPLSQWLLAWHSHISFTELGELFVRVLDFNSSSGHYP